MVDDMIHSTTGDRIIRAAYVTWAYAEWHNHYEMGTRANYLEELRNAGLTKKELTKVKRALEPMPDCPDPSRQYPKLGDNRVAKRATRAKVAR